MQTTTMLSRLCDLKENRINLFHLNYRLCAHSKVLITITLITVFFIYKFTFFCFTKKNPYDLKICEKMLKT